MSAAPKLPNPVAMPAAAPPRAEQQGVAVSAPAEERARVSPAAAAVEVQEVAVIISKLSHLGVRVAIEDERVIFAGDAFAAIRPSDRLYVETGCDTIEHRVGAVAAALARGAGFGDKILRERDAATLAIRRGRTPRANHQRRPAPATAAAGEVA